jgi:hypoxanthine phosphoribosyltransferase
MVRMPPGAGPFPTVIEYSGYSVADPGHTEPTSLLAGALGYALSVKNVAVMNVEFYTGVDQRLDVPVVLPPVPSTVDLAGARVLIADDVADTGETLRLVRDFCADHVADARCAVLYQKPQSSVDCEYVWRHTDRWIDFPWSAPD